MRIADFIIKKISDFKIDTCFIVTGGGSLFLNDALFKNKKIKKYFCHHEQACAIAAEAYYRCTLKPALVQVTTGPGGINALNGIFGAFVDSIPIIVISGQVKRENISSLTLPKLRQYGDQEANIIEIVKPITKYSKLITTTKINQINEIIDKALFQAMDKRKGPVWIDVPIDIQGLVIDKKKTTKLIATKNIKILKKNKLKILNKKIYFILKKLKKAKRPVLICGNGIRFSNSFKLFREIIKKLQIPILTVWNSHDLIENNHKLYGGRPGLDGERAGNFVLQNSDLLIVIGARMHVRQVGFNYQTFARKAYKIMIDVDQSELNKKNLKINFKVKAEINLFLNKLKIKLKNYLPSKDHKHYLKWSKSKVLKFPVFQKKFLKSKKDTINPYVFLDCLFKKLENNSTIITGDGTAAVITFKVATIKKNQRLFTNKGCASMGYDLPALYGSICSNRDNKRQFYCITGDGSIMMNIQELQSLKSLKKNFCIFLLNNDGYHSIRQTQKNFFKTEIGCGPNSGLSFPNFKSIAYAFGLKYMSISKISDLMQINKIIKDKKNKILCEVFIDKKQYFEPRIVSYKNKDGKLFSPPLEDMSPRLSRKELKENRIIDLLKT